MYWRIQECYNNMVIIDQVILDLDDIVIRYLLILL